MPRKQYRADLVAAGAVADFGHITTVKPGDDDEMFTFLFRHPSTGVECQITAMVDPSEYPNNHDYQMFASDDASAALARALQDCRNISRRPLQEALPIISSFLAARTATGSPTDPVQIDSEGDYDMPESQVVEEEEDADDEDGDNEDWALEQDDFTAATSIGSRSTELKDDLDNKGNLSRARADLRAVKEAGLKVGVIGDLSTGNCCFVSIACRIGKLGISEEAQDAWVLDPADYLVLLIYFPHGYRSLEFLESLGSSGARTRLEMKTGLSNHYKPRTLAEAQNAFFHKSPHNDMDDIPSETQFSGGFRDSFISKPLNNLLNERLVTLLKYRLGMGLSWTGAHNFYNDNLGSASAGPENMSPKHLDSTEDDSSIALPEIVTQDEMMSLKSTRELSFPLLAAQFLLRHFVRCTEFCLVCFSRLNTDIEAIKPYVCNSPLCLYQYMSLGFGPSIEHEIIAEPCVTDLLISFCYASAHAENLHEYPDGLGLNVPHPGLVIQGSNESGPDAVGLTGRHTQATSQHLKQPTKQALKPGVEFNARFDNNTLDLLFDSDQTKCPFQRGQWVVLNPTRLQAQSWHCRVVESHLFPTVRVTEPIILQNYILAQQDDMNTEVKRPKGWSDVSIHIYDQNINNLSREDTCKIMLTLLDLLPSVKEMKEYLIQNPRASLSEWKQRINPASLGLLRWIIASNRSCIVQVDPSEEGSSVRRKGEARVQGVEGWLQFRFAMGAPDKEQRFVNAINAEAHSKTFPTIFAWHGSRLGNWHSIIREGLHAKKITNGRAFGDGVYHAKDFATSGGYTAAINHATVAYANQWRHSAIRPTAALALSEIVNAPSKFASQNPYYVVAQLDWIQTRYLFVKGSSQSSEAPTNEIHTEFLEQDPERTPKGVSGATVVLPITAIPKSRRKIAPQCSTLQHGLVSDLQSLPKSSGKSQPSKASSSKIISKAARLTSEALKALTGTHGQRNVEIHDDAASVQTELEDLMILADPEMELPIPPHEASMRIPWEPVLEFSKMPLESLPLTPSPSYATSSASKRLQKDFANLLRTQDSYVSKGTLADLGWYVDPDFISNTSNLYQWIAELHSFPLSLPLARDMKKVGLQSIVLEFRFHASYPMSPPFVRVVRPRFLPFASGGGGHVTAGGSICAQLLTNDGWTAVSDIESVLLQIRMAIMSTEPNPARLQSVVHGGTGHQSHTLDYGVGEAVDAFKRACRMHGWTIPEGLDETAF